MDDIVYEYSLLVVRGRVGADSWNKSTDYQKSVAYRKLWLRWLVCVWKNQYTNERTEWMNECMNESILNEWFSQTMDEIWNIWNENCKWTNEWIHQRLTERMKHMDLINKTNEHHEMDEVNSMNEMHEMNDTNDMHGMKWSKMPWHEVTHNEATK